MGKAARLKAQRREAKRQVSSLATERNAVSSSEQHKAAHEAGHAVVQWTLGIPFDYVSLDTEPPGVWPLPGVRQGLGDKWLIGAAGCIADYQSRNLLMLDVDILKLLIGSADGLFALSDQSGTAVVQPDRRPAVQSGGDLRLMAVMMAGGGDGNPWPPSVILGTWRSCEKYVSACTRAITAVTATLLTRRRLTYPEASEICTGVMSGISLPTVPEWFKDAQALSRRIEADASPPPISSLSMRLPAI